jgi:hypothetical protein
VALDNLLRKKRGEFLLNARKRNQLGYQVSSDRHVPPPGWRPKGQLRAHMHEHDVRHKYQLPASSCYYSFVATPQGAIAKLVRLPERPMFASAGADGCVRVSVCENQLLRDPDSPSSCSLQLWDCQKMEGSNLVNRAHKMFSSHDHSPLTALSVCGTTELFAAAAESGLICINRYAAEVYGDFKNCKVTM